MRRKIIFYLIIFLFLLSLADFALAKRCVTHDDCEKVANEAKRTLRCVNGECRRVRPLEITYPKIGGAKGAELIVEEVFTEGLPYYINYVFRIAVGLIGLVIFGVLIYNGLVYLTSAGNPQRLIEARESILYAFLGGLLLLSSVLIFDTINPQLKTLKLEEIPPLEVVAIPGVYICNYKVQNQPVTIETEDGTPTTTIIADIGQVLETYVDPQNTKTPKERIEAAKKLKAIMNIDNRNKKVCQKLNSSINLRHPITKDDTIFIIPSISITPQERSIEYKHGIVLHEAPNLKGKADYYPKPGPGVGGSETIYRQIDNYSAKDLKFTARSVTLFQKPEEVLKEEGVILYKGLNYETKNEPPKLFSLYGKEFREVKDLEDPQINIKNAGSINFSPENYYLAILCSEKNFEGKCAVLSKRYPDLSKYLPASSWWCGFLSLFNRDQQCEPQLNSMIILKGTKL